VDEFSVPVAVTGPAHRRGPTRLSARTAPEPAATFPVRLRDEPGASPLEDMDYYSDDYPDTPLEDFLAVYERLSKYAKREVHDLAESLATGDFVTEGDG